jgi:hypothetical protein
LQLVHARVHAGLPLAACAVWLLRVHADLRHAGVRHVARGLRPTGPHPTHPVHTQLRVEHAAGLKVKDILAALRKAAAGSTLRGLLAVASDDLVCCETGLAPAGSTALLRRFAVERSLAGGGWLVATATPAQIAASRCARAYTCAHDVIDGKAPDILAPAADADEWTHLPNLSTLSVRVVSTLGFTEPQWEVPRRRRSSPRAHLPLTLQCASHSHFSFTRL